MAIDSRLCAHNWQSAPRQFQVARIYIWQQDFLHLRTLSIRHPSQLQFDTKSRTYNWGPVLASFICDIIIPCNWKKNNNSLRSLTLWVHANYVNVELWNYGTIVDFFFYIWIIVDMCEIKSLTRTTMTTTSISVKIKKTCDWDTHSSSFSHHIQHQHYEQPLTYCVRRQRSKVSSN